MPRIDVSSKHPSLGESLELICQVKNLPKRFEMNWVFNEKKIIAPIITRNEDHLSSSTNGTKKKSSSHRRHVHRAEDSEEQVHFHRRHIKRNHEHSGFSVYIEQINNVTVSRLRIKELSESHRGVYKCRYDKIETKHVLEFKGHLKSKLKVFDYLYSSSDASGTRLVLKNSEVLFIACAVYINKLFHNII